MEAPGSARTRSRLGPRGSAAAATLIALAVFVASCSVLPEPDQTSAVDATTSSQPDARRTDTTTAPTTSAVDAEIPTTEPSGDPPTSIEAPVPITQVWVSPQGNDALDGQEQADAVASVDRAVELLDAGGTIILLPGEHGPIELIGLRGTAELPYRLRGEVGAQIRSSDYRSGAGVRVENSEHVIVEQVSVGRALWGVYITGSHDIALLGSDVADIGQEAVRVKDGSSRVVIEDNRIADTGRRTDVADPNGEGIYIGTGTPGGVDLVTDITIRGNRIERTADEAIDIKRPSTRVEVIGNVVTDIATGTSGAITVHLGSSAEEDSSILLEGNLIRNVTRTSSHRDANCIVVQTTVSIVNNVLQNCLHRGIYVRGSTGVVFVRHNTFLNAGRFGAIDSEGNGQAVVSENNFGIDGTSNREGSGTDLRAPETGDFHPNPDRVDELRTAPAIGVTVDFFGNPRPVEGPVTFGAVEAQVG